MSSTTATSSLIQMMTTAAQAAPAVAAVAAAAAKPTASFGDKILTAASQGAAGAIIGAMLSSVTEPFANRLLVKRMTVTEAFNDMKLKQSLEFFQTTLPTNFIKFPLFEALNEVIRLLNVPPSLRGVVTGAMFTTATLPITNYRYCKSMNEEVSLSSPKLWIAYAPTVVRDIIYAQFRNAAEGFISANYPHLRHTTLGRVIVMFIVVFLSCVISSPCNEWRGYMLQPKDKRRSVAEFFQLQRYLRSTLVGAGVMGTAMGIATLVGPPFQQHVLPVLKDVRVLLLVAIVAAAIHAKRHGGCGSSSASAGASCCKSAGGASAPTAAAAPSSASEAKN